MQKNENGSIFVTLYKVQVKANHELYPIRYAESNRRESSKKTLKLIGTEKIFLNRTPMTQTLRLKKNDKWDLRKVKSFKRHSQQDKSTIYRLGKKFTNPTFNRGLISKICMELKKLNSKKTINQIQKWGTELNREFRSQVS